MKHKIILLILLISSIFLTSCGDFSNIKKNQLVVVKLDKNTISTSDVANGKKILTDEGAKLKALEILEKYFNVKLYLTEVGSDVQFINSSMLKKELGPINPSSYSKTQLEYSKSVLENGFYAVDFFTRVEKQAQDTNYAYFSMKIDSKTGECIYFSSYDTKVISSSNSSIDIIDINEAKKIAKEFILKNNIGNIKNIKLVNQNPKSVKSEVGYSLLYEDADVASNKVMIVIDGSTKKIYSFSIGVMEVIQSNPSW
ncbi:YcdB/YcdC domain-containing protein [Clostridium sp. CF012]|uniref:YcdB/YcdC domain-containing protein n=1 Tax=Clostridium sp. CF012 TaxID=2843319 RepID=UPI001C0E8D35|nr:YcdB/YcdC domain-containing protein [Clostridium sp. CF012]MBU3143931.1 hypothetical protein [Clostridium sp. CF012]